MLFKLLMNLFATVPQLRQAAGAIGRLLVALALSVYKPRGLITRP
jgi:hypothetical protein